MDEQMDEETTVITAEFTVERSELSPLYESGLEIAHELVRYHPAYYEIKLEKGEAVAKKTMLTIGLMALQVNANPNPTASEIYAWIDWKGQVNVYLGIAYWRKAVQRIGGFGWVYDQNATTKSKMPAPRQTEEGIAYSCHGYLIRDYKTLIAAGIPWDVAQWQLAREGFGMLKPLDMQKKNGDPRIPPNGRSWEWVAAKRAECDLIKKLMGSFDIIEGNRIEPESNPLVEIMEKSTVTADDGY